MLIIYKDSPLKNQYKKYTI